MNDKNFVWCECATYDTDSGRHECSVTGDGCMFLLPNAAACAKRYGEGPLADSIPKEDWQDGC